MAAGRWDCALVLPPDFETRLKQSSVEELFTLLIGPGSAVYPMVRETVSACVAEAISPGMAEDYLLDSGIVEADRLETVRPRLRQVLLDRDRVLVSMERKITDRQLDVEADIPEEPILVLGDNDMITQVIYNLLENAAKFATAGTTLYLGVTLLDGKARVTVRNEGATIPAEELPLLFERFHKSDKSRSLDKDGVGLGLYIVKTILEQHKEKINVTSENGVTAFSFSLAAE